MELTLLTVVIAHTLGVLETIGVYWLISRNKRLSHVTWTSNTAAESPASQPSPSSSSPPSDSESRRRVHYLTPSHEQAVSEIIGMQAGPEDDDDADGLD